LDAVRRAYGDMAGAYTDRFGTTAQVDPDDLARITRRLAIRPGVVADAGCGPGHLTAHLQLQGVDAIGIDLVPELLGHARAAHPHGSYVRGSMERLPVPDGSLAGVLAWYSLIHLPPDALDGVLAELRRAVRSGATLVVGFFDGGEHAAFEHKVATAYFWPVDELGRRLEQVGFTEVERWQRPAVPSGPRAHAAIVATADEPTPP